MNLIASEDRMLVVSGPSEMHSSKPQPIARDYERGFTTLAAVDALCSLLDRYAVLVDIQRDEIVRLRAERDVLFGALSRQGNAPTTATVFVPVPRSDSYRLPSDESRRERQRDGASWPCMRCPNMTSSGRLCKACRSASAKQRSLTQIALGRGVIKAKTNAEIETHTANPGSSEGDEDPGGRSGEMDPQGAKT